VLLAVLAALGPCSIQELDFHLGAYSPGPARLAVMTAALVRVGELTTIDRLEVIDGCLTRVAVFSLLIP